MACVWRHPESKFWFARFTDATGKQVNRTTRQTTRAQAQKVADGFEHAVNLAQGGLLTREKASAVVSEILERVTGGTESLRSEPTDAFLQRWLEHKSAANSATTAERYAGTVEKFLAHLGDRRSHPIAAIRTKDVQSFLTARARERSTKTVAVDGKTLAAAFTFARRQGLIDRNPVEGVEVAKVESMEREVFTPAQVQQLVNAAEGDWKTCVLVGYYIGARLSDVTDLEWTAFDLVGGTVTYRQRKTGEKVTTPLHPELTAHLEAIAGDSSGPVMPSLHGKGTGGCNGLSMQFNALMRRAGIAQDRATQKSGRSFASLSFHSLRHAFESHLANAGVTAELRRKLTGRATDASQRTYTHLEMATMREAVAKLPTLNH